MRKLSPSGLNDRVVVGNRYAECATASSAQFLDVAMLREKFDHMASTKNTSHDCKCPDAVRRTIEIARGILNKRQAIALDGASNFAQDVNFRLNGTLARNFKLAECAALNSCLTIAE